jgi:macrodomain Ter protein organizer (MatP/YcbG family)
LLSEGQLAEAIKVLRESHGLSSRQASRWVDAHIADDPMLQVQLETRQRARRRRAFAWFLLADVLVTALVIYYFFHLPR